VAAFPSRKREAGRGVFYLVFLLACAFQVPVTLLTAWCNVDEKPAAAGALSMQHDARAVQEQAYTVKFKLNVASGNACRLKTIVPSAIAGTRLKFEGQQQ
jgi:hypothetical protein